MSTSFHDPASVTRSGVIPGVGGVDAWAGTDDAAVGLGAYRRLLARGLGLQLLLGLLLLGPVFGWFAYAASARQHRFATEAALGDELADRTHELDSELECYAERILSLRGFFDSSNFVDRSEFRTFTRDARARHPEIAAIGYAPRVTASTRAAHEADAAKDGLDRYQVTVRGPDGVRTAAPPSPEHYPVYYVEPMAECAALLGFDLGSDEIQRSAIRRTVESGQPSASAPLALWPRSDGGLGAYLVLGVYDAKARAPRPGDVPSGVVFLSFQFEGAIRALQASATGPSWSWLDLTWTDETVRDRPRRVFPRPDALLSGAEAPFAVADWLGFAGKHYALRATPTAVFLAQHRDVESILFATIVFAGWELLGLGLYVIARSWRTSALRRQSRAVGLLLRSLGEGVIMADRDGTVRLANDAALRMLGVPVEALRAPDWFARCGFVRRDGRTAYDAERVPLLRAAKGEVVPEEEMVIRRPDESRGLSLWASARPLMDEGNVLQGGVMVLRDITAQRRSEEATRRLASALEQTADAVLITDQRGLIRYVNPGFRTTTGFSEAEVLGRSAESFEVEVEGREDDVPSARRWSDVLAGRPFRGVIRRRRHDGTEFEVEQTITPMTDEAGRVTHAVAVLRDITERRHMEETEIEMKLAAEVQQRLYPHEPPTWEGLDVAGAALPAVATCGDYFDYVRFVDGTYVLVIGDVSGHGLGPALVMAETRAYLRSLVESGVEMGGILARINARLRADLPDGTFVTLLLVGIDPATGRITHASAGHTPAVLIDAAGALKARLMPTGPALGIFDRPVYRCEAGPVFEEGDVLVLLTDGVSECAGRDRSLFDEEGVVDVVARCHGESAARILGTIHGAIDVFSGSGERQDDVTLIVCRRTGCLAGRSSALSRLADVQVGPNYRWT